MAAAAISAVSTDMLDQAIARFSQIETYRATLHSSHDGEEEHIRYHYRTPGNIRMEFLHPHAGAVLVYDPATRRVRLWPFGAGRFPELKLDPANRLIRSARGQQVDRSDVGALLRNVDALRHHGTMTSREETREGKRVYFLDVVAKEGYTLQDIKRYEIWLNAETLFPVQVISYGPRDTLLETVRLDDIEIDAPFSDTLFDPQD